MHAVELAARFIRCTT